MPSFVHLIEKGGAIHATVDVMDFQGTEDPALVTCPVCLERMRPPEAVVGGPGIPVPEMPTSAYPDDAVELPPPDDLESLSLAEHLGILVASHVTMLEQQRDQARMWAVTLEGQLAEAAVRARAVAEVIARVGTTFAADTDTVERLNRFLEAVGSPETPDQPQGD